MLHLALIVAVGPASDIGKQSSQRDTQYLPNGASSLWTDLLEQDRAQPCLMPPTPILKPEVLLTRVASH